MPELTFGEQVKVVLKRKGMTIKELAGIIEEQTGKKMSRQNLTQRLSRDNFQEQDMRMIAGILECPFYLSILDSQEPAGQVPYEAARRKAVRNQTAVRGQTAVKKDAAPSDTRPERSPGKHERDITIGELLDIHEGLDAIEKENQGAEEEKSPYSVEELLAEVDALEAEAREGRKLTIAQDEEKPHGLMAYLHRNKSYEEPEDEDEEGFEEFAEGDYEDFDEDDMEEAMEAYGADYATDEDLYIAEESMMDDEEEDTVNGDVNPYTGREYKTNSVRMHPDRIGYVQVYDRADHRWTDMTEWAFLGYQERKKALLGKDYVPPIYLD